MEFALLNYIYLVSPTMYSTQLKVFSTLYGKKSTFLPYRIKKYHSTVKIDTFKGMLLISYLAHAFNIQSEQV